MSLFHFKNIAVRELAWVMCSPNLLAPAKHSALGGEGLPLVWDADCRAYYQRFYNALCALDHHPQALHDWLQGVKSPRLGIRFERYLEYWLRWIVARETDVLKGVSLRDSSAQGRTLGQLDFVWRDDSNNTRHWEAAVKFYLYYPKGKTEREIHSYWLGPSANDSLEAKIAHLIEHQIPIGNSPVADRELALRHWTAPLVSAAFLKGYLFYPLAELSSEQDTWRLGGATRVMAPHQQTVLEQQLSRAHLKGWWVRFPYAALPRVASQSRWLILPKRYWLAPFRVESAADLQALGLRLFDDLQLQHHCETQFSDSQRSLMVLEMLATQDACHEIARGMILHPLWPEFASD